MERMSGIDAGFLYMETPTLHMHTLKVAVLEPAPGADSTLDGVRAALRARLHLLPAFRRRIVEIPFGFHHPVWIEDPAFDLDAHVRCVTAPPPGGARELDAIVSRIASTPLERTRPLWEIWLVEGLSGGRVATVAKIHHAVADGLAAAAMLANVLSQEPGAAAVPPPPDAPWTAEPPPSGGVLLRAALRDHVRGLRRLPPLVARTARNGIAVLRHRRASRVVAPRPVLDVPRTPLNGPLSARRAFATRSLSLDAIRAVKSAVDVSVNDVLLGLVASSLRAYLARRDALPAAPLVVEVPTATDVAADPPRLQGNRVSNLFTSLRTDVADPVERLRAIHEAIGEAKRTNEILGPELFREWTEFTPPRPFAWAVGQYVRHRLARHHAPPINAIVSSVAGPRRRLHWSEGSLESISSVGPLVEGVALNVTAWSYVDRMNVGVLVCPDLVDGLDEIADGIAAALDELVRALVSPHAA